MHILSSCDTLCAVLNKLSNSAIIIKQQPNRPGLSRKDYFERPVLVLLIKHKWPKYQNKPKVLTNRERNAKPSM